MAQHCTPLSVVARTLRTAEGCIRCLRVLAEDPRPGPPAPPIPHPSHTTMACGAGPHCLLAQNFRCVARLVVLLPHAWARNSPLPYSRINTGFLIMLHFLPGPCRPCRAPHAPPFRFTPPPTVPCHDPVGPATGHRSPGGPGPGASARRGWRRRPGPRWTSGVAPPPKRHGEFPNVAPTRSFPMSSCNQDSLEGSTECLHLAMAPVVHPSRCAAAASWAPALNSRPKATPTNGCPAK